MTFDSYYTDHFRLPFFGDGHIYSAEADRQRFVTLDRNLESYIGIVGIGVLQGWIPQSATGLSLTVSLGSGFVNGYYSESGWVVKLRDDVTPEDNVIQEEFYVNDTTGDIYDKIEYVHALTLPDNADVFLYAYRNSNYLVTTPYYEPDNVNPEPETSDTLDPSRTAVSFAYTGTKASASRSGRIFLGQIVTRNGQITEIDTSAVRSLANFEGAIREYADFVLRSHKHGGDNDFDPPAIRLQTDRRDMVVSSAVGDKVVFIAKNSEVSTEELDHYHSYFVDEDGDGITIDLYGDGAWHFHEISAFSVGSMKGSVDIENHTHELTLPEEESDGWDESDPVQIYINGEPYYGDNATVDASNKQVTFEGDVTVKFRKYGIDHDGWVFESEERTLYRFMLRAALAYGSEFPGQTNIIVPDPATPITVLRDQSMPGDARLVDTGDTFTFVSPAADNVTVTLLEEAHVDSVEIEVLTNSEIAGRLPQDNILYIPASKIVSGEFEPEAIPMLSHLGRFLEFCSPRPTRARSTDGRVYLSERDDVFGNVKIVHSAAEDGNGGYILGTSDGVYRKPAGGAYVFYVNGVKIVTETGDIRQRLEDASLRYKSKTGIDVVIDSSYDDQIEEAEVRVTTTGDYYNFQGNRNEAVDSNFDDIWLFFESQYKLAEYGYETTRFAGEVLPNEEIVREIEQEVDPDDEDPPPPLYLVRNDFHKWTPKLMFAEYDLSSGYGGGLIDKFYSVTSSGIFTSISVDKEWRILDDSGIEGYVYDFSRSYSGKMAAVTSLGIRISTRSSGTAFRQVKSPIFGYDPRTIEIGFQDRVIMSASGSVAISDDLGATWSVSNISNYEILHLFSDNSADSTTVSSGHSHDALVDARGDGQTSEVAGHSHVIAGGVLQEDSGHTHDVVRKYYSMSAYGEFFESDDNGLTWSAMSTVPITYSEWGTPFAAFGNVYLPVGDGVLKWDGSSWSLVNIIDTLVYSSQWSYYNDSVLLGTVNGLYSFDGTEAVSVYSDTGSPVPKIYKDSIERKFGFLVNNLYNSYDFGGDILLGTPIDVVDSFSQFYPELDGWADGIDYDLYLNEKLLKSTRRGIDRSGDSYVNVSNESVITFSVSSTLSSEVSIGDTEISVADASEFPESGTASVLFAKKTGELFADRVFYDYYAKSGNTLLLSSPAQDYSDSSLEITYAPEITGDDDVQITVYDGKIENVGINTHEDIEDALSVEDSGLPKRLADVYESNLLHLTIAAKYIFPTVDDEMENQFITNFNYNFIEGDPDNIDNFIDREKSDLASLSIYKRDSSHERSSAIRRVTYGFGDFEDSLFVASNVGLFISNVFSSFEGNWIRVDVDGSSEAYDVMQHDNDTLYVATNKGLYVTSDSTFSTWELIDENRVGGIPTRVVPRWGTLVDEETGIDYWWGDWDGNVHVNEALVNTIIVSGDGFISHSDDRGISWLDGKLYDSSGGLVSGMTPVSYTLLRNGSIALCAKSQDGSLWGVYISTGTGSRWDELYAVPSVTGTLNSIRVSDNLNSELKVTFDSDVPPDNSLVGREFLIGPASYVIVENSGDSVTVFGDDIVDTEYTSFEIAPWNLNVLHEDSEKRLSIGSSAGMLWDNGGFFNAVRRRDGNVVSVGNQMTVTSLNVSGNVDSIIPLSSSAIVGAVIDKHVVTDELVGMTMKFASSALPDVEITSNGTSRHDGTVSITVSDTLSGAVNGDLFVIESSEFVRAYVTYDGAVSKGDLDDAYLVLSPEGNDLGVTRENFGIMRIISNTDAYIDISREVEAAELIDPLAAVVSGTTLIASNGDGKIPVVVEFDTQRSVNELSGKSISVSGSETFPEVGEVNVVSNDEISVILEEQYSGTNSEGETGTYSVFNTISSGEEFFLSSLPFVPRKGFTNTRSSVNEGHYHTYEDVPGPITGSITGFGDTTSHSVEILLEDVSGMDNAVVEETSSLFEGDTLLAYDPDSPSVKYRLEIISHDAVSESITVARRNDRIDIAGDDNKKVGEGFSVIFNTSGYGVTGRMTFTEDFVVSTIAMSEDGFIGDDTVTLSSVEGLGEGVKIVMRDDTGIEFRTEVVSVSGNDVTLLTELTSDLLVSFSGRVDVLYGVYRVGETTLLTGVSADDFDVQLTDASEVTPGDFLEIYDGQGSSDYHAVSESSPPTVNLDTALGKDYPAGSVAVIKRANHSSVHYHVVQKGQFNLTEVGGNRHGHFMSSNIREVVDMKTFSGTSYVVGSGDVSYMSYDNGESWRSHVDFSDYPEFDPVPSLFNGVYSANGTIIMSPSSGFLAYQSEDYVRYVGSEVLWGDFWSIIDAGELGSYVEDILDGGEVSDEFEDIVDSGLP